MIRIFIAAFPIMVLWGCTVKDPLKYRSLLLTSVPEISILQDTLISFTYETTVPCRSGKIYFGHPHPKHKLDYPQFRVSSQNNLKNLSKKHIIQTSLKKIDNYRYDFAGVAGQRIIMRTARLCLWNPEYNYERIYDFRFAYHKKNGKYSRYPCFSEGPFVSCVLGDSAVIWWKSDLAAKGVARLNDSVVSVHGINRNFSRTFNNLSPQTDYTYRSGIVSGDDTLWSRAFTFRTPPLLNSQDTVKFVYMSDSRSGVGSAGRTYNGVNLKILEALCVEISRHEPAFITFGGDLVDGATILERDMESQLRSWKLAVEPLFHYIPFYTGIGNHESLRRYTKIKTKKGRYLYLPKSGQSNMESIFAQEYVNPKNGPRPSESGAPEYSENVYSFDFGNCHVVSVNTVYWMKSVDKRIADSTGNYSGIIRQEQLDWLDSDLAHARKRGLTHIFIFGHQPIFPNGGHVRDAMWHYGKSSEHNSMRSRFLKIISRHECTAYFCGDEHNYSTLLIDSTFDTGVRNPVWQIVSGGAGAPLYARNPDTPWASKVSAFEAVHHFCLITASGSKVTLKVIDETGSVIDLFALTE
jgi:hypothetical protein